MPPRCACGGTLVIVGEIKEGMWRVGFRLLCKNCGKKWVYQYGMYREEKGPKVKQ